jgi:hypothetical protein
MSSSPPLKPWTDLPKGLQDLPRKGFVLRQAATHEEAEQREIIFGVETIDDLLRFAERRRHESVRSHAKK